MLALQGQAYQSPDKLKIKTLYHRLRCIPPSRSSSEVNLLVKVHAGIQGGHYHLRHAVTFKVHHHLPRWSLPCNGTYWFPGVFHLWHTPRSKALVILQDSYSLGTRAFQGPDHTFGTITRSREHMTYQGDTPSVLTAFSKMHIILRVDYAFGTYTHCIPGCTSFSWLHRRQPLCSKVHYTLGTLNTVHIPNFEVPYVCPSFTSDTIFLMLGNSGPIG